MRQNVSKRLKARQMCVDDDDKCNLEKTSLINCTRLPTQNRGCVPRSQWRVERRVSVWEIRRWLTMEFLHHQLLKFFHSCHMHFPRKHLETNSSITIIYGMTYPANSAVTGFFSLVFLLFVLLLLRKNNVIFLQVLITIRLDIPNSSCDLISMWSIRIPVLVSPRFLCFS